MTSPISPRHTLAVLLAALATTLCVGMLAGAPALALTVHVFSSSFGGPCSSGPCGKGQFEVVNGIAVNEVTPGSAGDVYVGDIQRESIEIFNAQGTFVSEFPTPATERQREAIAVDNSTNPLDPSAGDVYVTVSSQHAVDKFSPAGLFLGRITTGESGAPLGGPEGLAVDSNGVVWVQTRTNLNEGVISVYSDAATNEFLKSFRAPEAPGGLSVDSEDDLYYLARGIALKLGGSGQTIDPEFTSAGDSAEGVAVDLATNDVYFDEENRLSGEVTIAGFNAADKLIERFGSGDLTSADPNELAVDSASGTVYAVDRRASTVRIFTAISVPEAATGEATSLQQSGLATLNGVVDPEGAPVTSCVFEYGETTSYGQIVPCAEQPSEIGSGNGAVPVHADISGLTPLVTYHFRLAARSATGTRDGQDREFSISTQPGIASAFVSSVGATAATVSAQINPGGLAASYRVEYGQSLAYGSSTAEISIGAGASSVGVRAHLIGLQAGGVTYHFRVRATNALGTTSSGDLTFATLVLPGSSALTLPDDRAYEIVSPLDNADGDVYQPQMGSQNLPLSSENAYNPSLYPFQVSPSGKGVVYVADPTAVGGNGQVGNGAGDEFFATRGPDGWSARDIQPPYNQPFFQVFSEDLSVGVLGNTGNPTLGVPGAEGIALFALDTADNSYQPVYPSRQTLESVEYESGGVPIPVAVQGLNADGSHLIFEANTKLTNNAPEPESTNNLYDSMGGHLSLVNVLPDGTAEGNAIFGGLPPSEEGPSVPDYSHDISADGSRIFWTDLNTHKLYVRENDTQSQSPLNGSGECTISSDACTIEVDVSHNRAVPSGGGQFWTATRDGSKVFFTACTRLTADSTAVSGAGGCSHGSGARGGGGTYHFESNPPVYTGNDLYEYDVKDGTLKDLTVDHNSHDALGADVQGVVGTSESGAYVYFLASAGFDGAEGRSCLTANGELEEKRLAFLQGKITEEEFEELRIASGLEIERENEGEVPRGLGCNLYVSHEGGAPQFVASVGSAGEVRLDNSEVTPDGQHLVFESGRRPTGYDNLSTAFSRGVPEVYLYDANTEHLTCASCDPSGVRPASGADLGGQDSFQDNSSLNTDYIYHPHWISADGKQVFFNSADPLVSQDTNGSTDVYEWESGGGGGCPQADGCVYLLSGGIDSTPSFFVGASASGEDVFFVTRAELVAQDRNDNTDLYDARVGGGVAQLAPPACTGAGCQGVPPAPPTFATPASATFAGVGNFPPPASNGAVTPRGSDRATKLAKALKACRRKSHGRRARCERRARKRYGTKSKSKKPAKGRA